MGFFPQHFHFCGYKTLFFNVLRRCLYLPYIFPYLFGPKVSFSGRRKNQLIIHITYNF